MPSYIKMKKIKQIPSVFLQFSLEQEENNCASVIVIHSFLQSSFLKEIEDIKNTEIHTVSIILIPLMKNRQLITRS